jgi:hypothetical protein
MPASQEQKLIALSRRVEAAASAAAELARFIDKVRRAAMDGDIGPTLTSEDKAAHLARYPILRQAVLDATGELPADLSAWEPDPSEYEESVP